MFWGGLRSLLSGEFGALRAEGEAQRAAAARQLAQDQAREKVRHAVKQIAEALAGVCKCLLAELLASGSSYVAALVLRTGPRLLMTCVLHAARLQLEAEERARRDKEAADRRARQEREAAEDAKIQVGSC